MADGAGGRLAVGGAALVALWISVYWMWNPREDGFQVSFDPVTSQQASEPRMVQGDGSEPAMSAPPLATGGEGSVPAGAVDVGTPAELAEPAGTDARIPPDAVIAPEFRDYTVRPGDTFERIAQRELGDSALGVAIAKANPFKDPLRLEQGETIRIPLDPSNIQGRRADGSDPPPPPEPVAVEYVVQSGDTLGAISLAFYGSTRKVQVILDANPAVLRSADELRVGQRLLIPREPR